MWYKEGTVSVSNNSKTVVGVGTAWVANIRAGDGIQLPDGKMYEIINVASDTSISIEPAYGSATVANRSYWIIPVQGYVRKLADKAAQLLQSYNDVLQHPGTRTDALMSQKAVTDELTLRILKSSIAQAVGTETNWVMSQKAVTDALELKVATNDSKLTDSREWTAATVTKAEAEAGTATTRRAWTAERVREAAKASFDVGTTPAAGRIPAAGASGKIDNNWLHYNIPKFETSYPGLDVVSVHYYDTTTDSDGGDWTGRTASLSYGTETRPAGRYLGQFTSADNARAVGGNGDWYYNPNIGKFVVLQVSPVGIFRAGAAAFPKQAVIAVCSSEVVIFDATGSELTMWKVLTGGYTNVVRIGAFALVGSAVGEGKLYLHTNTTFGLLVLDFAKDQGFQYTTAELRVYQGSLAQGNDAKNHVSSDVSIRILNNTINAVALIVLPNAPRDAVTGLKIPTVALGTPTGVCVIHNTGKIVSITHSANPEVSRVWFIGEDLAYITDRDSLNRYTHVTMGLPQSNVIAGAGYIASPVDRAFYSTVYSPAYTGLNLTLDRSRSGEVNAVAHNNFGTVCGLTKVHENPKTPSEGLIANISKEINTGWQVGNSEVASLCSTDVGVVNTPELWVGPFTLNGVWTEAGNGEFSAVGGTGFLATNSERKPATTYLYAIEILSRTGGSINLPYDGVSSNIKIAAAVGVHIGMIKTEAGTGPFRVHANAFTGTIGKITVREVVAEDYSGNNNHLFVKGSLNRAVIGSGEIAHWSGFSAQNMLISRTPLNIGTGDFSVFGWVTHAGGETYLCDLTNEDHTIRPLYCQVTTQGGVQSPFGNTPIGVFPANQKPTLLGIFRKNGKAYISINGRVYLVGDSSQNLDLPKESYLFAGCRYGGVGVASTLSHFRVSKKAPSPEQVAKMYFDEAPMVTGKAVMIGSSNYIYALDYDRTEDMLYVKNYSDLQRFQGLSRVDSHAIQGGKSVSVYDQHQVVADSFGFTARFPEISIREKLNKAIAKPVKHQEDFFFTGATGIKEFALPNGWKPKRVWVDGGKKRFGSAEDYTVTFDGFVYSVSFGVAPALNAEIDVEATNA